MPNDVDRARDEHVMSAFGLILVNPMKLEISLNGELWIERMPDNRYRVLRMHVAGKQLDAEEENFEADDMRSAIGYFLDVAEGRAGG